MQASAVGNAPSIVGRVLLWSMVLGTSGGLVRQAAAEPPAAARSVEYVIVVTGTELLAGAYADAHAPFLTRTLHPRGLRCAMIMIVDDRQEEIEKAVRLAMEHAPLVITTGGLGPTEDDVTRQAISAATGIPLAEHPALLAAMAKRFGTSEGSLRANLRRQTQAPVGGSYLENPSGTAAGLVFESERGVVVALPGPPRELQPMVHERLLPFLAERFGICAVGGLLRIRFVGIGESAISEVMERHISVPEDVTVGALFEGIRVDYYFSLPGASPEDLARLDAIKRQVTAQLGEFVYGTGTETLESAVAELLAARRETLALAEIGSGGFVASSLGGSEAANDILAGAYVATNEQRLQRLLEARAEPELSGRALAERLVGQLAERTAADWSVYLGPIRDSEAAGRSVDLVVRRPDGHVETRSVSWRGSGELGRFNLTTQVLDILRRNLSAPKP